MGKLILLIATFFSVSFYVHSQTAVSVPFVLQGNHIIVYAKVNKSDSLKFIFDTGADGTSINRESINKVKLNIDGKSNNVGSNGTNEVEESYSNDVYLGAIHKKNVDLAIIPMGNTSFDGVIGTDIMFGHVVEIDYQNQMLVFYAENDKTIKFDGYQKMKMSTDVYPTCVNSSIIIDGKKYNGLFGIDTGADDALTLASPFSNKHKFIDKMSKIKTLRFSGSDGSNYDMFIVLCPEVEFAQKHLYNVPVALSTSTEGIDSSDKLAGFYGNGLLKKFNIIVDYKNRLIYFKLNKNLYTEFLPK